MMKYLKHIINRIAGFVYFKSMNEFTLRETSNHTTQEELDRLNKKYHGSDTQTTKIRPDEELPSMWGSK